MLGRTGERAGERVGEAVRARGGLLLGSMQMAYAPTSDSTTACWSAPSPSISLTRMMAGILVIVNSPCESGSAQACVKPPCQQSWSMASLALGSHTSVFSAKAPNLRPLDTATARHFPAPGMPGNPAGSANISDIPATAPHSGALHGLPSRRSARPLSQGCRPLSPRHFPPRCAMGRRFVAAGGCETPRDASSTRALPHNPPMQSHCAAGVRYDRTVPPECGATGEEVNERSVL